MVQFFFDRAHFEAKLSNISLKSDCIKVNKHTYVSNYTLKLVLKIYCLKLQPFPRTLYCLIKII